MSGLFGTEVPEHTGRLAEQRVRLGQATRRRQPPRLLGQRHAELRREPVRVAAGQPAPRLGRRARCLERPVRRAGLVQDPAQ